METKITFIYGLYEKNNPETIRYIGKSNYPNRRLKSHIYEAISNKTNTIKSNWIKSVLNKNEKIGLKLLKICPLSEYEFYETEFIKLYKSDKLTNSDDTGQGNQNRKIEIIENAVEKISKKVYQFDLNANYINEFKSARETGRQLNIDHSNIIRCCNEIIKHTNGFIFRYNKDEKIEPILLPNSIKKLIIEIDDEGNKINEWKSLMDCSRDTGIDNGNLNHIKRRIFQFIK